MKRPAQWPLRRLMAWIVCVCIALLLVLAVLSNVNTELSKTDIQVLRAVFGPQSEVREARSFEEEIRLIHLVKDSLAAMVPGYTGIPQFHDREPADLFRNRSGLCFDRSRTIEKALTYLGFKTRHVFLLFREDKSFLRTVLTRHSPSHAVSEVMTSRGWLLVDSNTSWIALTTSGIPITANQLPQYRKLFDKLPPNLETDYWSMPGLYSRQGFFYRPFIPFPDVNWKDAFSAIVED